jgi:hypothetical protein
MKMSLKAMLLIASVIVMASSCAFAEYVTVDTGSVTFNGSTRTYTGTLTETGGPTGTVDVTGTYKRAQAGLPDDWWFYVWPIETRFVPDPWFMKSVGDTGFARIQFGSLGIITDTFVVTSISPWTCKHKWYGTIQSTIGQANLPWSKEMKIVWYQDFAYASGKVSAVVGSTTVEIPITVHITYHGHRESFVALPAYYQATSQVTSYNSSTGALVATGNVQTGGDIPTLSEWGMILFGVVLLGMVTWYVVKRRRVNSVVA